MAGDIWRETHAGGYSAGNIWSEILCGKHMVGNSWREISGVKHVAGDIGRETHDRRYWAGNTQRVILDAKYLSPCFHAQYAPSHPRGLQTDGRQLPLPWGGVSFQIHVFNFLCTITKFLCFLVSQISNFSLSGIFIFLHFFIHVIQVGLCGILIQEILPTNG